MPPGCVKTSPGDAGAIASAICALPHRVKPTAAPEIARPTIAVVVEKAGDEDPVERRAVRLDAGYGKISKRLVRVED